eukprot:977287-Pyramimonas_sp.AAC.1
MYRRHCDFWLLLSSACVDQEQRRSVHAIYAWCRALDETVDAVGAANASADQATLNQVGHIWSHRLSRHSSQFDSHAIQNVLLKQNASRAAQH